MALTLFALSCTVPEVDLCDYDLECAASSECPDGATCVEGRCMPAGRICPPFGGGVSPSRGGDDEGGAEVADGDEEGEGEGGGEGGGGGEGEGEGEAGEGFACGCQPGEVVPGAPPAESWVQVCPGEFLMGSPGDEFRSGGDELQHRVRLTQPFLIRATEVTQAEWLAVMGDNASHFAACGGDCPVENVSWLDAAAFCNALSTSEGLEACYVIAGEDVTWPRGFACGGYRLPTEAEWEYAARAGTTTAYHTGDDDAALERAGWFVWNSDGATHPVAGKEPNAWGLYDVHGNVWEWAWDWYGVLFYDDAAAGDDPVGPAAGAFRVLRGGGWDLDASWLRAADRSRAPPTTHSSRLGFRPARSVP